MHDAGRRNSWSSILAPVRRDGCGCGRWVTNSSDPRNDDGEMVASSPYYFFMFWSAGSEHCDRLSDSPTEDIDERSNQCLCHTVRRPFTKKLV